LTKSQASLSSQSTFPSRFCMATKHPNVIVALKEVPMKSSDHSSVDADCKDAALAPPGPSVKELDVRPASALSSVVPKNVALSVLHHRRLLPESSFISHSVSIAAHQKLDQFSPNSHLLNDNPKTWINWKLHVWKAVRHQLKQIGTGLSLPSATHDDIIALFANNAQRFNAHLVLVVPSADSATLSLI
jgi:hypothetical protein